MTVAKQLARPGIRRMTFWSLAVLIVTAGTAFVQPPSRPITKSPTQPDVKAPAARPGARTPRVSPSVHPDNPRPFLDGRPDDLKRRIANFINLGNSSHALKILAEQGSILNPKQRTELVNQAVNLLAERVEIPKDPAVAMKDVREAQANARLLRDPKVDRILAALEARLDHQSLLHELQTMTESAEKGQWNQGAARAPRIPQTALTVDIKNALAEFTKVAKLHQALDLLDEAQKIAERNRPEETAAALLAIPSDLFSGPLRDSTRAFRGLTEIWAAGQHRWHAGPTVASLKQSLAEFQTGTGNQGLAARLQQDLAVKLFLEGYPRQAREMLTNTGSAAQAAELLDDVKALALGRGKISTWPAQRVQDSTSTASLQRVPPAGVRVLIPEDKLNHWQAPALVSIPDNVLPLKQVADSQQPVLARLRAGLLREREILHNMETETLNQLRGLLLRAKQQGADDSQLYADLEGQLERKLGPADRALVWHFRRQGLKLDDMVTALR
jgi:hypothetical protein